MIKIVSDKIERKEKFFQSRYKNKDNYIINENIEHEAKAISDYYSIDIKFYGKINKNSYLVTSKKININDFLLEPMNIYHISYDVKIDNLNGELIAIEIK